MKSFFKVLLGFNAISIIHLMRLNFSRFVRACVSAFASARHAAGNSLSRIPEISLEEILADRKPVVRISIAGYEDGMLPSNQAIAVLAILVAESPCEALEIGTFMGHTTRQIAENLGPAGIVHTVDLPEDFSIESDPERNLLKDDLHLISRRMVGREFKGHPSAVRIKQHFGDTARWDFTEAGQPTFFFIDGAHTYDYCKNDSQKCLAISAPQGVFLWHDCDDAHPGVLRLISEWRLLGRDVRRISGTPIAYWKCALPNNER